ncbi:MAG TPA: hypothetical protein VGO43_06625 [Pyrinomonadaceae bacterium]|jgi:hypothetical protein|nr:hypothetical protein [Pyrinomonadaceae bacterium]
MGRKFLAVITALITSLAVIWLGWMISTLAAPTTPSQMEHASQADLNHYANTAPTMTYAIALISYAIAGFAGGFVVTKMASRWSSGGYSLSLLVGALLTAWAVGSYFLRFAGPVWFLIGAVVIFIPFAAFGHRLAEGRAHPHIPETS